MARWHSEYFKLKEFENMGEAGRLLWILPPPTTGHIAFCERCPPYTWRKEASLSLKTRGCLEESQQTGPAESPPGHYTDLLLNKLSHCCMTVLSSSSLAFEERRFNCFVSLFSGPARDLKRIKESFSLPCRTHSDQVHLTSKPTCF